ncbi:MAG TPA: choice-of-anchor D domain-containing protein [Vulgatibacter sp.]|nr:choice-of-anchor D domain-containing protein [Vulgatibacter sp.]
MRRAAILGLAAACLFACGDDLVTDVRADIVVTATHVDDEGRKLLDFGPVAVLERPKLSVLVENRGRAPLRLLGAAIEDEAGVFHVEGAFDGTSLLAAESVEIPVVFEPTALGSYEGKLILTHDDAAKGPVEVRLIGDGSTVARVELEPEVIDFGLVGERMQEVRTLTIRSVGTGPLLVDGVEWVENGGEFAILGSPRPAKLPPPQDGLPGGSVDLRIACSPLATTEGDSLTGVLRIRTTDPDRREVLVQLHAQVNHAPIAVIAVEPGVPSIETPIAFDGSGSFDPDDHVPLAFAWRIFDQPLGANATFSDPTAEQPTLVVDTPGVYEIGLDVTDSMGLACYPPNGDPRLPCARTTVTVKTDVDLQIELIWDHPVTDLDLHLVEDGMPLYSASDCFWANKKPDFGNFGDTTDDPEMIRESLKGFGPETVVFPKPSGGTYGVRVEFAKSNGSPEPATKTTLRVYVYGVLEAEYTRTLDAPGQLWEVLDIAWPSAVLTPIDELHVVAP